MVRSVYGIASVGYKGFLFIDGTLRNDWSSTLPVENNSYLYPSIAGSFVFSDFIKSENILSFGKLKASWASIGSDTNPYQIYHCLQCRTCRKLYSNELAKSIA